MPREIKLIGLDLDNTALNAEKKITPAVAAAISRAIGAGIEVLPATGRTLSGIPKAFFEIPGVRYALASNGAKVYDVQAGKVLISDCFAEETALDILDACVGFDLLPSAYIDGVAYMERCDFETLEKIYAPDVVQYMRSSRTLITNLRQKVLEMDEPVEKMSLVFANMEERQRVWKFFEERGGCTVTSSLPSNIELNTPTANKGAALLALGRLLGIGQPQIMAVGDSSNDLEMMRAVGYAVAMGNATPDILAAADDVTLSAEEDGVALAIEKIMPKG